MSDSETSLDSEETSDECVDWKDFIRLNSSAAAPAEAFNQPPSVPQNPFQKGHLLLAIDPNVPGCNVLAQVEKTHKCWVRIKFLEFERLKTWKMCDSDEMKYFDEQNLHRHPDNPKSHTGFYKWIAKKMDGQSEHIASKKLFTPLTAKWKPKKNLFTVGMVLAVFDDAHFTGKLRPATVVGVNGDSVRLQIAGRPQSHLSEIILPFFDRRLFPIDFLHKHEGLLPSPRKRRKCFIQAITPHKQSRRLSGGMEKRHPENARRRLLLIETLSRDTGSTESSDEEETEEEQEEKVEKEGEEAKQTVAEKEEGMKSGEIDENPRRSEGVTSLLPTEYSPFNNGILSAYQCLNWSAERQEHLLKLAHERLSASTLPRQIARRFMNIYFPTSSPLSDEGTCVVNFDFSASVGSLLDAKKVRQMPLHFSRTHYVQQVQKVAQFLVYCGKSQQDVVDAICSDDDGTEEALEIYIRGQELKTYRIPKPPTFNRARYFIHNFLHHLNADRNLIDLVKSEEAFSKGQRI